jgi:3-oxoacyl-[acyl-carrier protein] reductase
MKLSDLRIVVTGAASGMGRIFTRELLAGGASVAALDFNAAGLESLRTELAADGRLFTYVADVSNEESVVAAFDNASRDLGSINGLINSAGIFRDMLLVKKDKATGAVRKMPFADWQKVIDVDLTGPFLCTREFAARIVENNAGPGVVVNLSSAARHGNIGQSNYSAAKAGLVADTVVWARELARYGVRVAAIAPGFIDTPILQGMRPEVLEGLVKTVPLHRVGQPEEIWQGVRFIIECDYFTGRCLDIDGGLSF